MKPRITSLIMITLAATLSVAPADDSTTEQRLARLEARVQALEQQLQQQAAAVAGGAEAKPSAAVPAATVPAPAPAAKAKPIVILAAADGKYSISGEAMNLAGVAAKLKEFGSAPPEAKPAVAIQARERVSYGNISVLLDACQAEGIWDVSFATRSK